jgi:ATP-dependent Clp protease protease subunit
MSTEKLFGSDTGPFATMRDEAMVQQLELETEVAERTVSALLNTPQMSGSVTHVGDLGSDTATQLVSMIDYWRTSSQGDEKMPIHITMSHLPEQGGGLMGRRSAPGTLFDTYAIYDALRLARKAGHHITGQAMGTINNHMAIVLQICDRRLITPSCSIMLREEEWGGGRVTSHSMEDEISFRDEVEQQGRGLLIARSDLTLEELESKLGGRDPWWVLSAEEALNRGLVDEIITEVEVPAMAVAPVELLPSPGESLDIRKDKAIIRKAQAESAIARFQMREQSAKALENGRLLFFTDVNPMSATIAVEKLKQMARRPGSDVDFVINSPGGSIIHGGMVIDTVNELKHRGHCVNTLTLGMAASMGGVFLQMGAKRKGAENGWVLVHRASGQVGGSKREMDAQKAMLTVLEDQVIALLAERSHLTEDEIRQRTQGRDWWMRMPEALEVGLIDEIV